jgi:hypothetical protein
MLKHSNPKITMNSFKLYSDEVIPCLKNYI